MEILVDLGNTRIRWATPEQLTRGAVAHGVCDELPSILGERWGRLETPTEVWVSSVAGAGVNERLSAWTQLSWKQVPRFVSSLARQLGVANGYANPAQLGVDRWMSLIGARSLTRRAVIVVDAGTATTIDAMDHRGRHLGGLILPGVAMMQKSLSSDTAIPPCGESRERNLFATDTASGIYSAAVLSTRCTIETMRQAMRERVRDEVVCIMTGGAAEALIESAPWRLRHEPHLVLIGLARAAAQKTDS